MFFPGQMTLNNEVFAMHRGRKAIQVKQTFRAKVLRCESAPICTADRRSHPASGEEGAKDVKSGELGGVARLWGWPCVTSKGEDCSP